MPDDKIKSLYDHVSEDYDLRDYDTFLNAMQDEGKRRIFFDTVSADYDLKTWEEFNEAIMPERKTTPLIEGVGKQLSRGWEHADISELAFESAVNIRNWDDVNALRLEYQKELERDPVVARGFLKKAIFGLSQMAPPMAKGIITGQATGLTAAAVAAAAGLAGPQALVPEEVFTVPAAYAAGTSAGAGFFWYKQAVGGIYSSMRDAGVSHELSSIGSLLAGIPYVAIEMSQIDKIAPGLIGTGVKAKIGTSVSKAILKAVGRYVATV